MEKFESEHCQGCGFHESLTDLDAHHFAFEDPVCPLCQYRDRRERRQQAADDEWREKRTDPARKDPADGRRTIIRYKGKAKPPE